MAEEFANKIKRLELENFTCFGKVALDFSPGINVFIGENGTGKTYLLKALLMSTNTDILDRFAQLPMVNNRILQQFPALTEVFLSNYYPPSVRAVNLIKKGTIRDPGSIKFKGFGNDNSFELIIDAVRNKWNGAFQMEHKGVFIPSQEMLSWFKGFIASYENRESSIDPTYYLLAKSLALSKLKGEKLNDAIRLSKEIEEGTGVTVQLEGDEFFIYYKKGGGIRSALEASGINKLAEILHLIYNGSLTKDTILFWDEPEANLNPKYISVVSKFLQTLANAGCQIFVATHDYLLLDSLSMAKQFQNGEGQVPDMKFFSLIKGENGTEIETGGLISEIQNNPILDEYARLQETKLGLYAKQLETT